MHSGDAFLDGNDEGFRAQDLGVIPPAENPALNFLQGTESHGQLNSAPFDFANFLGGVPIPFPDQPRGKGIKANFNEILARASKDAEATFEFFFGGKTTGAIESFFGDFGLTDAGEGEGADLGALGIMGQEVPSIIHIGQVVGVDRACLRSTSAEGLIGERNFLALNDGTGKETKNFQIGGGGAGDTEGVVGAPFAQIKADRFLEGAG